LLRRLDVITIAGLAGLAYLWQPAPCAAQPSSYTISTVAGNNTNGSGFTGDNGPATNARLNVPVAVALDSSHNLYIADSANHRIRMVAASGSSAGRINTIVGNGTVGYAGDGGPATAAELYAPYGVRLDAAGNLYISDLLNHVVRKVDTKGKIGTYAGNNQYGYFGDGVPATSTSLNQPVGLAFDAAGNLYIGDSQNDRVRTVSPAGIINTLAGNGWTNTAQGDGGPAAQASVWEPFGVAVDGAGNVYIADSENNLVRMVTPSGLINTVAGASTPGFYGDGNLAAGAQLNRPWDVVADAAGDLYIADYGNSRIRMVDTGGIITTIAGGPGPGYAGDGGPATAAKLQNPSGIARDTNGNLYIADSANNVIRLLTPTAPAVASGGVVTASGFGGFSSIAPGSWIEIYGANLALDRRSWAASDFQGATAPTALDGTTVTIGGQTCYLDFISGGQVNAQVPFNVPTGQQPLVVKNAIGTSATYTVTVNATQPGLLAPAAFHVAGIQYAGALFTDGVTYAIPPGAVSGVPSQRAKAGQTIVLYGVGFGAVIPNIPAGQIVSQSNTLSLPLQVNIGGTTVTPAFAGLVAGSVGLYQINVVVPSVPASDKVPLTFSLGGSAGRQTLYIAVQ